jgi:hypothetical protein
MVVCCFSKHGLAAFFQIGRKGTEYIPLNTNYLFFFFILISISCYENKMPHQNKICTNTFHNKSFKAPWNCNLPTL